MLAFRELLLWTDLKVPVLPPSAPATLLPGPPDELLMRLKRLTPCCGWACVG